MAHSDTVHAIRGLRLNTSSTGQKSHEDGTDLQQTYPQNIHLNSATYTSQDNVHARATPPIPIPHHHDEDLDGYLVLEGPPDSYVEQYLRNREAAGGFGDAGQTSAIERREPCEPSADLSEPMSRGRSYAHTLAVDKSQRAHSESDRARYNPKTGRPLPKWSTSPPREQAHVGEARFPLLQETVDELARLSQEKLRDTLVAEPDATKNESFQLVSPTAIISPSDRCSASYENLRSQRRKASERWRDGEATSGFFSRMGSVKGSSSLRDVTRASRRDTNSSTRSPQSAASSFLRGFSVSEYDRLAPLAVDAEGATIGEDYVLGKQIGFGGFSTIKEVTQMREGRTRKLAVKIVRKQIQGKTEEENAVAQLEFEHEVELWRHLNHKHILCLEAVYELEEATFCFVPLNTGGTLFDVVSGSKQGLSNDLAANYVCQLASAVRYLHLDARVVHRDIKLENCLVDTTSGSPGLLRVCDFGLAEWLSSDYDSTSNPDSVSPTSSVSVNREDHERSINRFFGPASSSSAGFAGGSLEYAAPEILRIATSYDGDASRSLRPTEKCIVNPAVDIWAMGVCTYSLLMGRRPFQDNFQPRVVMAILAGDWPRKALKQKVELQAYALIKDCLSMRPETRPSISEVYEHVWLAEARSTAMEDDMADKTGWRL